MAIDGSRVRSRKAGRPNDVVQILGRVIQIGDVISVDKDKNAARVRFPDTGIISDWLKILDNRPYIPDYENGESELVRWEEKVLYGETEETGSTEPEPEPEPTEEPGEGSGEEDGEETPEEETEGSGSYNDFSPHTHELKIRMWVPKIGDRVLCIFLPVRNGDGFVVGKIW